MNAEYWNNHVFHIFICKCTCIGTYTCTYICTYKRSCLHIHQCFEARSSTTACTKMIHRYWQEQGNSRIKHRLSYGDSPRLQILESFLMLWVVQYSLWCHEWTICLLTPARYRLGNSPVGEFHNPFTLSALALKYDFFGVFNCICTPVRVWRGTTCIAQDAQKQSNEVSWSCTNWFFSSKMCYSLHPSWMLHWLLLLSKSVIASIYRLYVFTHEIFAGTIFLWMP